MKPKINLFHCRMLARMTQKELAEKIGTTQSYISEIESSKTMPSIQTLCDLSQALGVTVTDILVCEDERKVLNGEVE